MMYAADVTSILIPRSWRWRITCHRHADDRYELTHRSSGARLAWIVPEHPELPPHDAVLVVEPGAGMPKSWVVVDGNMVTRWVRLQEAILYAAQPRGQWNRPWPWKMAQFYGDWLRNPLALLPVIAQIAAAVLALRAVGLNLVGILAAIGAVDVVRALSRFVPWDTHEPDTTQCSGELDGWTDDPMWRALDDSVVWAPGDKPCPNCGEWPPERLLSAEPCAICRKYGTVYEAAR